MKPMIHRGESAKPHAALLAELERRHRRFVWPTVGLFVGGYLLTILLIAYSPAAMSVAVVGQVNVGYLLVVGNFAATFLVAFAYRWYAQRRLDPLALQVREVLAQQPQEVA